MKKIKVAIAGVGNCASSFVQGTEYYRRRPAKEYTGLMHASVAGWRPGDIEVVAAFDIDHRKVGHALEDAVFAAPNCTRIFQLSLPFIPSYLQTTARLSGTDIILSLWILAIAVTNTAKPGGERRPGARARAEAPGRASAVPQTAKPALAQGAGFKEVPLRN